MLSVIKRIFNHDLSDYKLGAENEMPCVFGRHTLPYEPVNFLKSFNRILELAILENSKRIRLNKNGKAVMPLSPATPQEQYDFMTGKFNNGTSIIINGIDGISKEYADSCSPMDEKYKDATVASMFLTPYSSKAFSPHFDMGDVLVYQVAGRKKWYFGELAQERPIRRLYNSPKTQTHYQERILETSDWVFIPAGTMHHAESIDSISLHLTYSTHSPKVFQLLSQMRLDEKSQYKTELNRIDLEKFFTKTNYTQSNFEELLNQCDFNTHERTTILRSINLITKPNHAEL